jgi:hypothetical protein
MLKLPGKPRHSRHSQVEAFKGQELRQIRGRTWRGLNLSCGQSAAGCRIFNSSWTGYRKVSAALQGSVLVTVATARAPPKPWSSEGRRRKRAFRLTFRPLLEPLRKLRNQPHSRLALGVAGEKKPWTVPVVRLPIAVAPLQRSFQTSNTPGICSSSSRAIP